MIITRLDCEGGLQGVPMVAAATDSDVDFPISCENPTFQIWSAPVPAPATKTEDQSHQHHCTGRQGVAVPRTNNGPNLRRKINNGCVCEGGKEILSWG